MKLGQRDHAVAVLVEGSELPQQLDLLLRLHLLRLLLRRAAPPCAPAVVHIRLLRPDRSAVS